MKINNHTAEDTKDVEMNVNESKIKSSTRVNINNLMSKVRAGHKKQRKESLVFFGLISSVIVITGIIASL
tara:strand:+ start:450 stop:659 length:210 start_codon:yes stop_codon:yes gene_type:complete